MNPITIIGAGLAGYTVAREFRKLDKSAQLTIVTADDGGFYSKPMLSNAFAQNKQAAQLVPQTAAQMASQLDARIVTGTKVSEIDTAAAAIGRKRHLARSDRKRVHDLPLLRRPRHDDRIWCGAARGVLASTIDGRTRHGAPIGIVCSGRMRKSQTWKAAAMQATDVRNSFHLPGDPLVNEKSSG
jgi:hypothetical protein